MTRYTESEHDFMLAYFQDSLVSRELGNKQFWSYVNDEYVRTEDAKISALDHGFLYADGVFDDMISLNGKIFRLHDHVERFFSSLKAIKLTLNFSVADVKEIALNLLKMNDFKDSFIRVVATRGEGYALLDPRIPPKPSFLILTYDRNLPTVVSATYRSNQGIRAVVASTRKTPSVSLESRIKSLNYLNNVLARLEAIQAGVEEAILLDVEGFVAEGPGSNICVIRKDNIVSPQPHNSLEGITLGVIMTLATTLGYKTQRANLTRYDLYSADELFLTATAFNGVTPVSEVDGRKIGADCPGPVTRKILDSYQELLTAECPPWSSGQSLEKEN